MTRVLGIMGSPRRNGNTHVLLAKVLEGAKAAGAVTELVLLNDLTIRECDGCHACWADRDCGKCDDMNALYAKIVESDALVLGTPVYWYGPTALMKAFIDRLVYFNCPKHRQFIRGKTAAVVIPFEEPTPRTAEPVARFFRKCVRYLEMRFAGCILVPGVTKKGDVRKVPRALSEAYELGLRLGGQE